MPRPIRLSVTTSPSAAVYYTDDTLDGVTITYGKSSQWEQARAPYMSAQILYTSQPNITLGSLVVVEMENHTPAWQPIFTGYVTDTSAQMLGLNQFVLQLTATGTLGTLSEKLVGSLGFPAQTINERITAILGEALSARPINDLTGTIDSNTGTIQNWDNYSVGGSTSTVMLAPYTGGITDANSLLVQTCQETFSDLVETPTGALQWREVGYNTGGIGAPSGDAILQDRLAVVVDGQNRYSSVNIDGPDFDGIYTLQPLVTQFGLRSFDWQTSVSGTTDPVALATSFLANSANAGVRRLEGLTLLLDETTTGIQNTLINGVPFMGRLVTTNVPSGFYSRIGNRHYIMGWSWNLTRSNQEISFNLLQSGVIGA
jgi:hypothetical protein